MELTGMKKNNFLLVSFLAMAMTFSMASCSGNDDPDSPDIVNPGGGTENPGGGSENPGGSGTAELTAAQAKQSLEATAQELLGKMNVSDLQEFKNMIDGVDYEDDDAVSRWFEACGDASVVSSSDYGTKYLIIASNFVGEFTLQNGVWKQTQKGGDHLSFIFNDKQGNKCVLTLKASKEGTEIHHDCFDDEDGYWDGYKWQEYKDEYRLFLPKKMELTLTRNGDVRAMTTVETQVKTNGEIDLTKDEVEITSTSQVGAYKVVVNKAAFKAGKSAEAKATVSKGNETLITVAASATGSVGNDLQGSYGKVSVSVDILGKAKVIATLSDVDLLIQNLDKADSNDENEAQFKQYLDNANKLIDARLYLNNSSKSSSKLSALC